MKKKERRIGYDAERDFVHFAILMFACIMVSSGIIFLLVYLGSLTIGK